MIKTAGFFAFVVAASSVALAACDKPAPPGPTTASATASAAASPPTTSAASAASAVVSAPGAPSTAPTASASSGPAASSKDVTVSVLDPTTDGQKSVKVPVGGSVTLYLPEWPGSSWSVQSVDRSLGKPKEQTIPGFAGPTTPAHEFKWKIDPPLLKNGETHKVQLVNKEGGKPGTTFALTIDIG